MAGWGGARPGGGRPKGLRGKSREEHALRLMENFAETMSGIPPDIAQLTPLDVMCRAMAIAVSQGDWRAAVAYASAAAPYLHPRLASIEVKANVTRTIDQFSDEELIALAGESESSDGVVAEDTSAN